LFPAFFFARLSIKAKVFAPLRFDFGSVIGAGPCDPVLFSL